MTVDISMADLGSTNTINDLVHIAVASQFA